MNLRPTLAAVLVVALASGGAAGAAPKKKPKKAGPPPVCNLIQDAKDDTFAVRAQDGAGAYGPQEATFDILSEDLGSDAKTLTAVIRVAKLGTAAGTAPGGLDFRIGFTLPGQEPTDGNFFLNARTDRSGAASFLLGLRTVVEAGQSTTAKLADATGVFDTAKNEVRISVPVDAVKTEGVALAPGMKMSFAGLDQTSARNVVVNPVTGVGTATFADVTASEKAYVAGEPSCVTPGV